MNNNTKKIVIIGVLAALAIVTRTLLTGIPNFQPATFIIIATGIVYGWRSGLTIGIVVALVSGLLTGIGVWTPFQMAAWGTVGAISGFIPRKIVPMIVWSILAAFLYGFISNLSSLLFISVPMFITTYPMSALFDLYHAIGNVIMVVLFSKLVFTLFDNYTATK